MKLNSNSNNIIAKKPLRNPMAQKALETAVRDLTKVISDLGSKVGSLECKVAELNMILSDQAQVIITQVQEISLLKSAVEGNSQLIPPKPTTASAPTPPAPRRPMRQTRLLAAGGTVPNTLSVPKKLYATATKKHIAGNPPTAVTTPAADPACAPEINRPKPKVGSPATAPMTIPLSSYAATQSASKTRSDASVGVNATDDGWTKVRRQSYKKRTILTGIGKLDEELQSVERLKYIQAWSFKPETNEQNVMNYLNKIHKSDKYFVQRRQIKTNRHAAFVIGIPVSIYDNFTAPTSWPPGVRVTNWSFRDSGGDARGDTAVRAAAAST